MRKETSIILLASVFLVASCALIYELVAGTLSSYLLGSSITQFSLVIGIFLSAMGLGSFLTKYISKDLIKRFIEIEIVTGILGGFSALLLFAAFTYTDTYSALMVLITGSIGTLIGLEIPLILRILKQQQGSLRLTVANVMTVDYIGALAASLTFPFLLVPHLGLMRASFLTGLLNLAVAFVGIYAFREKFRNSKGMKISALMAGALLVSGFIFSENLVGFFEERIYPDEIIYAKQTRYQRLVITRWKNDTRLFIDGSLQFSSKDEYRYHESLVHPAAGLVPSRQRILILGGGDGMAARECLKYPDTGRIDLVDIDPEMTSIFKNVELLAVLNEKSLRNNKVKVINMDALQFLKETPNLYDLVIIDLPDPSALELGKLYSRSFYAHVAARLKPSGVMAVQSASPYFSKDAFWCIINTIKSVPLPLIGENARLNVIPYHVNVPSFGIWGFTIAGPRKINKDNIKLTVKTKFLNKNTLDSLFRFPEDMRPRKTEINRLDNQILVQYYNRGYSEFYN